MIREPATVTRVGNGVVWVRCIAQEGCQRCAEGKGCGGGIFSKLLGDRLREVRVLAGSEPLTPGASVVIGLQEKTLIQAAAMMYLMPLLLMVAGAVVFGWLLPGNSDAASFIGALTGLLAGLWTARRFGRRRSRDARFQPRVLDEQTVDCDIATVSRRTV